MREIKFRAWDEQAKVMHNDFRFIKSGEEGNDWIIFTSDRQPLDSKLHPFDNPYFQQQLKIMQSTGLRDKNGKDIYEGDIVSLRATKKFKSERYLTEIVYHPPMFKPKENRTYFHDYAALASCEIVGNVHENPELIPNG